MKFKVLYSYILDSLNPLKPLWSNLLGSKIHRPKTGFIISEHLSSLPKQQRRHYECCPRYGVHAERFT